MREKIKRHLDERARKWRETWSGKLDDPRARRQAKTDMLVYDHGFLRELYANRHQIAEGVWRSSQPSPRAVRRLAKEGIRTIFNLRGHSHRGSYALEAEACAAAGITLIDFRLSSTYPPKAEDILKLGELYRAADKPILLHCKSGADRAGLGAALYLLMVENATPEQALAQLSLKYLHFRGARTGVLDRMFELFRDAHNATGISFEDWVRSDYDPAKIVAEFTANRWVNALTFKALGRE